MDENNVFNEEDMEEIIELDDADEMLQDDSDMQVSDEPYKDDSSYKFSKHEDSVFCCDVNSSNMLVATGGQDDKAYVWNLTNGEILLECGGHTDSVTCIGFSHDSKYLATGDMAGKIKVWSMESKCEILEFETSDLCWLQWHKNANILICGCNDGFMWMWKIPSGEFKHYPANGKPNTIGLLLPDGKRTACGYEDGSMKIWNLKDAEVVHNINGKNAHQEGITSLDCDGGQILASGSIDGTSKLVNINSGKILTSFSCYLSGESNSVESVSLSKRSPLLATGTIDGFLGIWDLNKQVSRFNCKQEGGITKILWNDKSTDSLLYTAGLDGIIRVWDARSGSLQKQLCGHEAEVLDIALTSDDNYLVSTSDDQTCRIFPLTTT